MTRRKDEAIYSLNETDLADLSIKELESRLKLEELKARGELWTGCGCDDYTPTCHCNTECHKEPSDCPMHLSGGMCPVWCGSNW